MFRQSNSAVHRYMLAYRSTECFITVTLRVFLPTQHEGTGLCLHDHINMSSLALIYSHCSAALSKLTTNLIDSACAKKRHLLSPLHLCSFLYLLHQSGRPLIGPIHHELVEEILEAGEGEEGARMSYLKVSLSLAKAKLLGDNEFHPPAPSPLCIQQGYTLPTHYTQITRKWETLRSLDIVFFSQQACAGAA